MAGDDAQLDVSQATGGASEGSIWPKCCSVVEAERPPRARPQARLTEFSFTKPHAIRAKPIGLNRLIDLLID